MPMLSRKRKRTDNDISDQENRLAKKANPPSPTKKMDNLADRTNVEETRPLSQTDGNVAVLAQTQPDPVVEAVAQQQLDDYSDYEDVHGRPGHMISIRLMNFMCHDNFFFEFSPRVNVIHGENGSGKSAILTAVMLIFGARASTTSRADSLKDFIKKGTKLSKIELAICNYNRPESEARAYKPQLYGRTIVIERIITLNGTSTFKVLNGSNQKVISKSRTDINDIAQHFRIKVDNPATVLTQEISKHFLNSKNPSDKYRFYTQATEIEDITRNYCAAKDSAERQFEVFVQRREILKKKEEDHNKIRQKYEILNKYEKNLASLEDLTQELEWAEINKQAAVVQQHQKTIEDRDAELQKLNSDKDKLEKRLESLKAEFEKQKTSQSLFEEESARLKAVHDNLTSDSTITSNDLKNSCRNYKVQQKRVQDMTSILRQHQDDLCKAKGDNNTNYESDLENIVKDIQKVNVQIISIKEQMCDLKTPDELAAMSRRIESLTKAYDEKKAEAHALKRTHEELTSSSNKNSMFGPLMDTCTRIIEKNKDQFRGPVYGPLAKYIKVHNKEQAPIVEKMLRKYMTAFLVTNSHDFEILNKIIRKTWQGKYDTPLIANRPSTELIDVSNDLARFEHYLSLWELFTITEKDVANFLIDNCSPQSVLFIPDPDEAYNHASRRQEFNDRDSKIYQVVSNGGDIIFLNPLRTYPGTEKDRFSKYLSESNEGRIKHTHSELNRATEEFIAIDRERNDLKRSLMNERKERDNKERFLRGLKSEFSTLSSRKEYIEEKLNEIRTTDFDELERKIAIIEEKLIKENEELDELKAKQDECKQLYENHQVQVDLALKAYNEYVENNQFEQIAHSFMQKINKLEKKIRELAAEISFSEERKVQAEKTYEDLKKELDERRNKAMSQNSQEMKNVRTVEQVKKAIYDYQSFLRVNQDIMQNKDKIREEYHKSHHDNESAKRSYQECVELHNTLARATLKRKRALDQVKWFTDKKVNYFFKKFLQEKGMQGKIMIHERDIPDPENPTKFLHRAQTLEIIARPATNKGTKSSSNYDSKSLSGGERSFSTVSFIVALWNIASTPFRILDEVDVFMDQATRQISLEMLVSFATNKSCDQFLFLSPLTIPDLEPSPKVKIFQMPVVQR